MGLRPMSAEQLQADLDAVADGEAYFDAVERTAQPAEDE